MPSKLTSKKDIDEWFLENAPHIKVLKWSGKKTVESRFIDLNRNIEFVAKFSYIKDSLKRRPNTIFSPTKEEYNSIFSIKKEDVIEWLNINAPHIKLIKWSGKATSKSLFIDTNRNIEFKYVFSGLKKDLERFPEIQFGSTSKEKVAKRRKTNKEKYGVINVAQADHIKEKIKQNNLKKYGHENVFGNKEIQRKAKQSKIKKYGVEYPLQNKEIKIKQEETCLKKYGSFNISQNDEIKKKKIQTSLKNWGVKNPLQNEKIREKIQKTCIKKFSCKHPMQNEKIRQKSINTNLKKYGTKNYNQSKKARDERIKKGQKVFNGKTISELAKDEKLASQTTMYKGVEKGLNPWDLKNGKSILEIIIEKFLIKQGLVLNKDFICNKILKEHKGKKSDYRRPDFVLLDYNLIIECDGEYYHDPEKDKIRNKEYRDLGYRLLCFSGNEILHNFHYVKQKIIRKIIMLNYLKNNENN